MLNKNKQISCTECGHTVRSDNLARHMRTHQSSQKINHDSQPLISSNGFPQLESILGKTVRLTEIITFCFLERYEPLCVKIWSGKNLSRDISAA